MAAQYSHPYIIDQILEKGSISPEDAGEAFVCSAENGRLDIMNLLLSKGLVTDTYLRRAFAAAVDHDFQAIIDRLLLISHSIREEYLAGSSKGAQEARDRANKRGESIADAIYKNQLRDLTQALESGPVSQHYRGISVIHAAQKGLLGPINQLLKGGSISDDHRGVAYVIACKHGDQVFDDHEKRTFTIPAEDCYQNISERLFADGPIPEKYLDELLAKNLLPRGGMGLILLAQMGRLDMINRLLCEDGPVKENGLISKDHCGRAFIAAVEHHRQEVAEWLWAEGLVAEESLEELWAKNLLPSGGIGLIAATQKGRLDLIDRLLKESVPISQDHRGYAFIIAVEHNYQDIAEKLYANGSIPEKYIDQLLARNRLPRGGIGVIIAAQRGLRDSVVQLLRASSISPDHRGCAFVAAATHTGQNYRDITERLFADGPIPVKCIDELFSRGIAPHGGIGVILAAERGYLDIINQLLREDSPISDEHRGTAFVIAAEHRYQDIAERLFANGPIPEKCLDKLLAGNLLPHGGIGVIIAVQKGRSDLINQLLRESIPISPNHREVAFVIAVEHRYQDIAERLFADGPIPEECLDRLLARNLLPRGGIGVIMAARGRRLELINQLLREEALISSDHRGIAFAIAVEHNFQDIAERLFAEGPIPEKYLDKLLARNLLPHGGIGMIIAAQKGRLDLIKRIQEEDGEISDDHRGIAFVAACKNNYQDIVERLWAAGTIPEECIDELFSRGFAPRGGVGVILSAKRGYRQRVTDLLQESKISDDHRGAALVAVASRTEPDQGIIDQLLGNGDIPSKYMEEYRDKLRIAKYFQALLGAVTHRPSENEPYFTLLPSRAAQHSTGYYGSRWRGTLDSQFPS
jgi:mannitol/fructose-specific phosphotransferase system IIA component